MNSLRLRVYPDPVLRKETEPVVDFDDGLKDLVAEMARLMNQHDGVGLAAPQAGVASRLAIVFSDGVLHVLANPVLLCSEGEQTGEEGCLSFPGIFGNVNRPSKVTIRYNDIEGAEHDITVEGFLARAATLLPDRREELASQLLLWLQRDHTEFVGAVPDVVSNGV